MNKAEEYDDDYSIEIQDKNKVNTKIICSRNTRHNIFFKNFSDIEFD